MPVAAPIFLVWYYFRTSILAMMPAGITDEIDYWHEILTFRSVGFAGGYYGVDEATPMVPFLHFGAHGPAFPALFGSLSKVVGWNPNSGPLFNAIALMAAVVIFLAVVKPTGRVMLLVAVVLATYWPITLYFVTSMQESLHQAIAIVLAAFFIVIIRRPAEDRRRIVYATVAVLIAASLLRTTWSFLFFPLFFLSGSASQGWRRIIMAGLKAAPLIGVSFLVAVPINSPFPNFVTHLMSTARVSPRAAVHMFDQHLRENVRALITGPTIDIVFRVVIVLVILIAIVMLLRVSASRRLSEGVSASWFHVLNLLPIFAFTMAFYDTVLLRDYRLIAPHLLVSILVAVAVSDRLVVGTALAGALAASLAIGPTFFSYNHAHFVPQHTSAAALSRLVTYSPGADPWRNTVLVDHANYRSQLLSLPPGIGFTLLYRAKPNPIRSHYLLFEDSTFEALDHPEEWQLLGKTNLGGLYVRRADVQTAGQNNPSGR